MRGACLSGVEGSGVRGGRSGVAVEQADSGERAGRWARRGPGMQLERGSGGLATGAVSPFLEMGAVEVAGESSGTRILARAALRQGRHLFVPDNCFRDRRATWAARLRTYDDMRARLSAAPDGD